ncbi:MAG: signal peptide peptidase SppA [Saprospiraceae bacterium]
MKNFFTFLFASCLGTLLAMGALVLIGVVSIGSIASAFDDKDVDVAANSVLMIDASVLPELTNNIPTDPFAFDTESVPGLRTMKRAIEKAIDDDDIKGIFLDVDQLSVMPATASSLRESVARFRESGKFVVSHSKYYTQSSYYLASVSDGVYLNPTGGVDVRGYGATLPFFKEGLDKLGVDINVFYAGDFKSAGEPFFRNTISDSNRLQTREYLQDLWEIYINDVSTSRGIAPAEVERLTENFLVRNDKDAIEHKFVDALFYKDQVIDNIKERLGLDDDDKIKTVSISKYANTVKGKNLTSKNKIAVIYAEGNIVDGSGEPGSIGDAKYAKLIRKVRKDKKVKAIVLRVNSGGGSAMASENIWRELQLAKEAGIPIITSMGDLAASGGYYIAMASDSIFAQPNTITGSIGVIGIIPNVSRLMDDKLGINFDTVSTGNFSNSFTTVIPWSNSDKAIVQEGVDDIYNHFIKRVTEGRGMQEAKVRRLAKGRVYTGQDAIGHGLIDRLAGLEEAIESAARLADVDLDGARIVEYPKMKSPQEQIIAELTGQDDSKGDIKIMEPFLRRELGSAYKVYEEAKQLQSQQGIQMRMTQTLVY